MTTVKERLRTRIAGQKIVHTERRVSWARADRIAGARLDRRRNYMIIQGQVCSAITWSDKCSGCSSGDPDDDRGAGCRECGYTGKSVQSVWMPHDGAEPRA